jgi:hypothetical protein
VKRALRYGVMILGVVYLWALLPVSFRPQYTGSPLRKPDQTLTIEVAMPAGQAGAVAASALTASATASHKLSASRIKSACEAPGVLKPIVRPAHQVVVHYVDNGQVVAETQYDCSKYR